MIVIIMHTHTYIIYDYAYIYIYTCDYAYIYISIPRCMCSCAFQVQLLLIPSTNPPGLELMSPRLNIETHSWHGCECPGLPKVRRHETSWVYFNFLF